MTITELQAQIGSNDFFVFTTDHDTALILTGLINNSGFSAVIFDNSSQSIVVVIKSHIAQVIVGRDIFSDVERATATIVGQTDRNLSIITPHQEREFYQHAQRMSMCIFERAEKLFTQYGDKAFCYWLEERLEINKARMDENRKNIIRRILNQS